MTKKLTIKCPYVDAKSSRILMYVYYDDTSQTVAQIQTTRTVTDIQGLEIFSEVVDEAKGDGASEKTSLSLTTLAERSNLTFRKQDIGHPERPIWTLNWEDGSTFEFHAGIELKTQIRCPILNGDRPRIELNFKFDYPKIVTQIQLEYFRELKSNFGELEIDDSGDAQKFETVFRKQDFVENRKHNRPHLFDFHSFMADKSLKGDSFWLIRFDNIVSAASREKNEKKIGLAVDYACRRTTDGGWGRTEEDAIKIWPLGIAPVGVPDDLFDITLTQTFSGESLEDFIRDGLLVWRLLFRSAYDSSLDENSFTPFAAWNDFFASPYFNALGMVKGGTPGSIMPRLLGTAAPAEKPPIWFFDYDLTDRAPDKAGEVEEDQFLFKFRELGLREESSVKVLAELGRFLDHDGRPVQRILQLAHSEKDDTEQANEDINALAIKNEATPLIRLKVSDNADKEQPGQQSRVGALNLHYALPTKTPLPADRQIVGSLRASLRGLRELDPTVGAAHGVLLPEFHAEFNLHLAALSPGGQDPLPQELTSAEDRLPGALIIPTSDKSAGQSDIIKGPFVLVATENSYEIINQTLAMRLENNGSAVGDVPIDFIVFDPNPFLIARVSGVKLSFGSEVGNWDDADPRGAFWELSDDGKGFDLILPPQIVGEEFIKDYAQVDAAQPLFYKFSPPAVFKLFRTAIRQNFSEAPWNLRRLFGLLGGGSPGAEVDSLKFELLYGLTTTVRTNFLRLAELDARIGHLPGLLGRNSPVRVVDKMRGEAVFKKSKDDPFVSAYQEIWERFRQEKGLVLTRLACLHPALLAQKESVLSLDSGVSFHLRSTRETSHPTGRNELPGFLKPEDGGLRGGVDWGFESFNIHTEVRNSGPSTSGQLVDPWFTALGGSGHQKAGFANDKSTILSSAFMGRTFFYSLQRIGRISVLWNTAKHVIIYERSVVDSQQFKDKPAGKPEGQWRGRPVVRKVEEYVEILQTERNYPEFGAAPKTRGFVLGSRFPKGTKILVDSKWGHDIPGGWIVPLHNPAEVALMTEADKRLYPRPDVKLSFATSEETGRAQSMAQMTNPEVLYFYTSTDPQTGKDTDSWPPVPDLDFPLDNVPLPPREDVAPPASATDAPLPDPPHTEGGYDRFTFKLDTAGQTSNLLADRLAGATEALIENVSMVRRFRQDWVPKSTDVPRLNIKELLEKTGGEYSNIIETKVGEVIKSVSEGDLTQIKNQLAEFQTKAAAQVNIVRDNYAAKALTTRDVLLSAQTQLKDQWETAWKDFTLRTKQRLLTELVEGEARFKEQKELILKEIERQIAAAESALTKLRQSILQVAQVIDATQVSFGDSRERVEEQIREALAGVAAVKKENPPLLEAEINRYLALATSVVGQVQNEIQSLKTRMGAFFPTLPFTEGGPPIDLWTKLEPLATNLIDELLSEDLLADLRDPAVEVDYEGYVLSIMAALDEYAGITEFVEEVEGELQAQLRPAGLLADVRAIVQSQIDELENRFFKNFDAMLKAALDRAGLMFGLPLAQLQAVFESEMAAIQGLMKIEFFDKANAAIIGLEAQIKIIAGDLKAVEESIRREAETAKNVAEALRKRFEDEKLKLSDEVRHALGGATANILSNVSRALAPYEQLLREEAKRLDLTHLGDDVQKLGDKTLRMVRAYGLAPVAQDMKLNRDRLAYYFDEAKREIDFTPATVLVNRVGKELENLNLKTVGIRLPSRSLVEQFVSDHLPKFNLRDVLPDFAGLNLESLFPGVRIPEYASDSVKITHGINRETRQAWGKCDVVLPLSENVSVFELGPVAVKLIKPLFEAHSQIAVDEQGHVQRKVEAFIRGDWHLVIMGEAVLMLVDCTLRYNNGGRISFDLKPSSVRLPSALQFLTDLVKSFRPGKASGLSFELVLDGGFPVGVRAVLNLPMPPLQTGAFAVSHIALRARFEIAAPGGQFYLGVGFSISSKERPFTLTILFLGGGGWIDALAIYKPFAESGKLSARLSIGLAAGADFAFDIGVAAGGVYFLVSLYAEFTFGAGGGLRIALRVAVGGEVVVLGFINVGIELSLEASYESGGSLRCRGELSLSIEICWCFTLEVHEQVEFTLAGGGGGGQQNNLLIEDNVMALGAEAHEYPPHISDAVDNYFAAFGA